MLYVLFSQKYPRDRVLSLDLGGAKVGVLATSIDDFIADLELLRLLDLFSDSFAIRPKWILVSNVREALEAGTIDAYATLRKSVVDRFADFVVREWDPPPPIDQDPGVSRDGGAGDDKLTGTDLNDTLRGFDGKDAIHGGGGKDRIEGGSGKDVIHGDWHAHAMGLIVGKALRIDSARDLDGAAIGVVAGQSELILAEYMRSHGLEYSPVIFAEAAEVVAAIQQGRVDAIAAWGLKDVIARLDKPSTYKALPETIGMFGFSSGADVLIGGAGNDRLEGGAGADKLDGGKGQDTASYTTAGTGVTANLAKPRLNKGDAKGDTYVSIENLTGSFFADRLLGNKAANVIKGGKGDDLLSGKGGQDRLEGGEGKDIFAFESAAHSKRSAPDIIGDFKRSQKDSVSLKAIDARSGTTKNDAFTFIRSEEFSSTKGELRYERKGGGTFVYGDVNGDAAADFVIRIDAEIDLKKSDFIL